MGEDQLGKIEITETQPSTPVEVVSRLPQIPDLELLSTFKDYVVPGIVVTNERYDEMLYQGIREKYKPNGYIVGVGAGNIFTMINAFPEGTKPQGIIMTDVDPAVVLAGKIIIEGLKRNPNWPLFARNIIYHLDPKFINSVIGTESSGELKAAMEASHARTSQGFNEAKTELGRLSQSLGNIDLTNFPFDDFTAFYKNEVVPVAMIARNYEALRKMAQEGKLVSIYGNLFDSQLSESLKQLPDFENSSNVIYYSNTPTVSISTSSRDGIDREALVNTLNSNLENLSQSEPKKPNANIYIGVGPGQRRGFVLTATDYIPQYETADFGT